MNVKLNLKPAHYLVLALSFALLFLSAFAYIQHNKMQREIRDYQNQVSELVGDVEIAEGVHVRLAEEARNLNRQLEEFLGENSRLSGEIDRRDERIEDLVQLEATLREEIRFNSENANSNATTTIITGGCVDGNSSTTVVDGTNPNTDTLPNLRVDFDLEASGFRATGHTTTNPSYAEVQLAQIGPFVIDLAITEDRGGQWRAYAAEQDGRLDLTIDEFVMNPYVERERWFERFGVGFETVVGGSHVGLGPILSAEVGTRWYVHGGALYDFENNKWNAALGVTWRPIRPRRTRE